MIIKACEIAYHWSPREAAAIVEYLGLLRDLVWACSSEDIIELRRSEDETQADAGDYNAQLCENQQAFAFDVN